MQKLLSLLLAGVLCLLLVPPVDASEIFTTNVTLIVDSSETPGPGPEENPHPNPPTTPPSTPSSGESKPSSKPEIIPEGEKSGGIDKNGDDYHLISGVSVRSSAHEMGYMYGFKDFTFGPDKPLTRGQFAVIMDRVFKFEDESITKSFEDSKGHWAEDSINLLASRGIIIGVSSTEFCPDVGLTRGAVLLMLSRVLDTSKYSKVCDLPSIKRHAASESIARIVNSGIYDELPVDFDVTSAITRGEMVHLLNNILYQRNATSEKTEQLIIEHNWFSDITSYPRVQYANNCIKSLDYNYILAEVSKYAF